MQALLPVSFMFSRRLKFPARSDDMLKHYRYFPHISAHDKPHTVSYEGSRRVHLELSLGWVECSGFASNGTNNDIDFAC